MQFLVRGTDGTDEAAPDRRLSARPEHLATADRLKANGNLLFAVAVMDDADRMSGSVMIVDFPGRAELDGWLAVEPYVVGDVWRQVEISGCRVGPSFAAPG